MAARAGGRKPDDLTRIEGIGPKTSDYLRARGVRTFAALSRKTADELRELLAGAPGRVATRDPSSWPEQARLASWSNWNSLKQLQDHLRHGVAGPPVVSREVIYVDTGRRPTRARPYPIFKLPPPAEIDREYQERQDELQRQYIATERACRKLRTLLESGTFGPITHCAPELQTKLGRVVSPLHYVITVSVPYKIADPVLQGRPFDSLPAEFAGRRVKVIESRPYLLAQGRRGRLLRGGATPPETVFPAGVGEIDDAHLIGGLPCSVDGDPENWGTLGVCLRNNGRLVGIVNAHFARLGQTMVQPPHNPFEPARLASIGKVAASHPHGAPHDAGTVDAAIVELTGEREIRLDILSDRGSDRALGGDIYFLRDRLPPIAERPSLRHQPILKVGARTGKTIGVIERSDYSDLDVDGIAVERVIRFRSNHGQTIVDCGDSGSVLLAPIFFEGRQALLAVGLVFAGDQAASRIGYACHFGDVISQLNLDVAGALTLDDGRWEFDREPL